MFTCEYCGKTFSRKDTLKRHGDCRPAVKTCEQCGGIFKSETTLHGHMQTKHRGVKRVAENAPLPITKLQKMNPANASSGSKAITTAEPLINEQASIQPSTSKACDVIHPNPNEQAQNNATVASVRQCWDCKLEIPICQWAGHVRSLQHRNNRGLDQEEGVKLMQTSFKNRIATYRLELTPASLEVLKSKFVELLGACLLKTGHLKVGMELFGYFLLPAKQVVEVKSFNTKFRLVSEGSCLEELFCQFMETIQKKLQDFQEKDSGWTLKQLTHVDVSVNKVNPLHASSYLPLPKEIERKLAVLNIKNNDLKCFLWSILSHLHPVHWTENANRVANYLPFEQELDLTGMEFPIKLRDISKFENLNNISVNVYGLENVFKNDRNCVEVVGLLHLTASRKEQHVNLLLISDDYGNNHCCLIRNMSRLISSQLSVHNGAKYSCDGCLVYFSSQDKLKAHQEHDCGHISVKLPSTDIRKNKYENILEFTNFEKKLKVPFVVYADFEPILEPLDAEQNEPNPEISYTVKTHKNVPYSFAYYIECDFDDYLSKFKTFRGQEAHKVFVDWLETDCKSIYNQIMKKMCQ